MFNFVEVVLYDGELFGIVWGLMIVVIVVVFEYMVDDKVL